ncbi:hypothetical protein CC2G_011663 [Coprinopsis cinerea AmutBmut pab1-1]|nr:hypothetical protein CC2G_011663 [Coprinopsis cinerea AmutBmut pab1-1]
MIRKLCSPTEICRRRCPTSRKNVRGTIKEGFKPRLVRRNSDSQHQVPILVASGSSSTATTRVQLAMATQQQSQSFSVPSTSTASTGYIPDSTAASTLTTATTTQQQQQTATTSQNQSQQSRQALEEARKDRTLAEFMLMLDDYEPLIPNEVTDYYLQKVGFECEDVRLCVFLLSFRGRIDSFALQEATVITGSTKIRV